jgi:hypothetical protein
MNVIKPDFSFFNGKLRKYVGSYASENPFFRGLFRIENFYLQLGSFNCLDGVVNIPTELGFNELIVKECAIKVRALSMMHDEHKMNAEHVPPSLMADKHYRQSVLACFDDGNMLPISCVETLDNLMQLTCMKENRDYSFYHNYAVLSVDSLFYNVPFKGVKIERTKTQIKADDALDCFMESLDSYSNLCHTTVSNAPKTSTGRKEGAKIHNETNELLYAYWVKTGCLGSGAFEAKMRRSLPCDGLEIVKDENLAPFEQKSKATHYKAEFGNPQKFSGLATLLTTFKKKYKENQNKLSGN